jgi:uncharacterized protein involved in outer membrane biogenesis
MTLRKKIFVIFIIFILLVFAGTLYLNEVYLPTKIKSLIIKNIEESTGKTASLDSVRFNILKGLVIRNLVISDGQDKILVLKEASCTFLLFPVFKKTLILPTVHFEAPVIFLERRKDSTFNLMDLFPKDTQPKATEKPKFNFFVYRLSVHNAQVKFQDDTFLKPYVKSLDGLDAICYLSLPAKVRFKLKTRISDALPIKIAALGVYKIPERELDAKVVLQDFTPKPFLLYYQDSGLNFAQGTIDSQMNLKFKDDILSAGIFLQSKGTSIDKKKYVTKVNSVVTANIWYNLKNNQFDFNGKAKVADSSYLGLDFIGPISAVNGEISFNKTGMWSDKLTANIWGVPIEAKGGISDFNKLLFEVSINSDLGLPLTQGLLKDKLKFSVPGDLKGGSKLSLVIQNKAPVPGEITFKGFLDIAGGLAKLNKLPSLISDVNGRVEYRENQVTWPKLSFKYMGEPYTTKGSVIDFKAPRVLFELSSRELNLLANFSVNDKLINIVNLSGHYLNSAFSVSGNINTANQQAAEVDLGGALDVELKDLSRPFNKVKEALNKVKPQGTLHADFTFNGKTDDLKSCAVKAKLSGESVYLLGLKADELLINYNQSNGLIDVSAMHAVLYGGTIDATVRCDTTLDSPAYWLDMDMKGIDLSKLKSDTPLKDEDIQGKVASQFKVNGSFRDLSTINGTGKISITDGKLWELDLFKGLGSLLLVKDFAKIIFRQGSCDFVVQDNYISTDNLTLTSSIVELLGPVKIGLVDNSIDADLEVNVIDEMVPLTGTFKDITTAIVGQAGKFGMIRITGTLKEPKFKFRPAVGEILKSLKNTIFGKPPQ